MLDEKEGYLRSAGNRQSKVVGVSVRRQSAHPQLTAQRRLICAKFFFKLSYLEIPYLN